MFQAKEHVDGCGGESQIAVLRNYDISGRVDADHVVAITSLLEWIDKLTGEVLLDAGNLDLSKKDFRERGMRLLDELDNSRETERARISKWDEWKEAMFKHPKPDSLGLPKLPDITAPPKEST